MSLLRDEDAPDLASAILVAVAIVAAIGFGIIYVHADAHTVTIHGRIQATAEDAAEGHFTVVPDGDGDEVMVGATGYLVDWFSGAVGHPVTLTITPDPER